MHTHLHVYTSHAVLINHQEAVQSLINLWRHCPLWSIRASGFKPYSERQPSY